MKKIFLFLMLTTLTFGQTQNPYELIDAKMDKIPIDLSTSTDKIAQYIKNNFKSENDQIRAAFYWTASNISYDIENMTSIDNTETSIEKIENTISTKKGVCIDYSEVFKDIVTKVGIQSRIIGGYTRQNGKVDVLSHAWCAAKIDNVWWLFDPTWGAGYVQNKKFFKKLNNNNYKVAPSKFIASHIPFDYLWQFLNYPVTNQEFIDGKTQLDKTKPNFDFSKELDEYERLSELEQARTTLIRIQKNGIQNNLIQEMVVFKKKEIANLQNNAAMTMMNAIGEDYNQAVSLFNDFIYYRNNRFKPTLPDEAIKEMIETPKNKILDCQNRIYKIGSYNDNNTENVKALKKSLIEILKQIEEQEKFVNEYLSKSKSGRKGMFTKITWMGIPVN
ncbi:transglutaminase domain-containing protein [Flavobacterium adhaerens]|uniref:transglutaminase domain-containing protein n=1 Tax=Flavobacterium adhaerens TaxID=3149043 RepID=UPI0032B345E4